MSVTGKLDANKNHAHGPEVVMTIDDLRERAGKGEDVRVRASRLLGLILERDALRDQVDNLRSAMAPRGVVDGEPS